MAFALTEDEAGSDPSSLKTTTVMDREFCSRVTRYSPGVDSIRFIVPVVVMSLSSQLLSMSLIKRDGGWVDWEMKYKMIMPRIAIARQSFVNVDSCIRMGI